MTDIAYREMLELMPTSTYLGDADDIIDCKNLQFIKQYPRKPGLLFT